jgi:hypothetical protein
MKRAALLVTLIIVMAPVHAYPEDITLFKHAYRKAVPPPPPPQTSPYAQYRVRPGDTLRKIFLKDFNARPEDLPALYRKFRQYNPRVRDLNRIISDYRLTIPTGVQGQVPAQEQKLTAQAQAPSGNVIVIKKGQHLAKVLRERYGLTDEAIFHGYLDKIKKLNPDIEDLNYLVEGQRIKLPDIKPAPQGTLSVAKKPAVPVKPKAPEPRKPKKLRIFEVQESAQKQQASEGKKEPLKPGAVEAKAAPDKGEEAKEEEGSSRIVSATAAKTKEQEAKDAAAAEKAKADEAREREAIEVVQGSLLPAFRDMGARQRDHGTYFLPVAGERLVSINTDEIPIIDLDLGKRIIVDVNNKMSPETRKLIEQAYPDTKVISGPMGSKEALMERLLDACGYFSINRDSGPVMVGEDEKIRLFGKWVIYKDKSRRNVIVINLLTPQETPIPGEIRNYASRFGIRLVEMGGIQNAPRKAPQGGIRSLGQSFEKLFGLMGVGYEKDKVLDLVALDSMKISYTAPMIVGKTIITGDMPDKTMREILQKSGYRVMDAKNDDLGTVLEALNLKRMGPPVRIVIAKGRAELDLPAVQVGEMTILEHQVDRDIVKYLNSTGVNAIVW